MADGASSPASLEYLSVGHLLQPAMALPATTLCGDIAALFSERPDVTTLVIQGTGHLGLVDRALFLTRYLERFNRDVYYRHPITVMMDANPLVVDAGDSIETVGLRITMEKPEAMRSGFIISREGRYAGVGSAITLMRAIAIAAQKASVAKSAFLANMSHEMRTPLHAVIGNLELLHQTPLDVGQTELARLASVAAHSLLDIIGDLLDLSKIEADRFEVATVATDLPRLVARVLAIVEPKARQKNLRLVGHIAAGVPETVLTDPIRLRQVLINFAGNAVKFTATGGVFLTVSRLDHGPAEAGTMRLRFEVQDTGPGFDPRRATALFEPFVQEDSSTTRRFGGTGLGLAISKRIVDPMGGSIDCFSVPGMGAAFWCELTLPAVPGDAQPRIRTLAGQRALLVGSGLDTLAAGLETLGCIVDRTTEVEADAILVPPGTGMIVAAADREDAPAMLAALKDRARHLVALGPAGDPEFRARAYCLGATHVFAPDVAPVEFAILSAGGGETAAAEDAPRGPDTRLGRGRLPVLIIDDTATNRLLAARQLAHFGLDSTAAENGMEGFERARRGDFSLILVDGAMPVMDGMGFARHFRAWEAERKRRRTPLIAITAHALVGDAERFKAAGMDDYLAKPVTLDKLGQILRRWLEGEATEDDALPSGPLPPFDRAALIDMIGDGDPAAEAEMLGIFVEDFATLLVPMVQALSAGDRPDLARAAHAGKSAAGSAAATPLTALLARLERDAATEDFAVLGALITAIEAEFQRCRTYLAAPAA